jgi:hypothetical protein
MNLLTWQTAQAAGLGLEKTMTLDEPLRSAFETIKEATCFDALTPVPHPDNLLHQIDGERCAMHRLGMNLTAIVGDPECEDLQYAAHCIRRYFGESLPMEPMPEFIANVPRFLLSKGNRTLYRTDPQELAQHLSTVAMPQSAHICIVSAKLALLKSLLHLSEAEVRFLSMAHVISSHHLRTNALSCGISMALEHIVVRDDEHRNRAIAALLRVAPSDAASIFTPPNRLKALRFVETVYTKDAPTLRTTFTLTAEFVNVLESVYRSHAALLQAIAEPEDDLNLLNDQEVPIGYLYETLPKEIAESCECAVLDRPLKAHHIESLVAWYTGGHRMLPSCYSALAGRITVEGVREAIKCAALKCCQANKPLDVHAVMKALYAAST